MIPSYIHFMPFSLGITGNRLGPSIELEIGHIRYDTNGTHSGNLFGLELSDIRIKIELCYVTLLNRDF
ncbi:MAG: hypothetical protein DRP08_01075 [Candidatus Aenigmatarchaeota archaeon]|nr:MAG: hypothetical protein DRP08_01075 [Candidatus Aenigmarchaeota archaeon]